MLVNVHHDSPAEHRRLLFAGVAFLAVIALLIATSIAIYQKVFDDVTTVTIKADRAGLQLAKFGDVRVHGVLVGQVRTISQDGKEAVIEVALEPDAAREIPRTSRSRSCRPPCSGRSTSRSSRPTTPQPPPCRTAT